MAKKKKKNKNKKRIELNFSSLVVILTIVHIDLFMIALYVLYSTGYGFNDTAIACFFSFYSIEVLALAGIKIGKTRYSRSYEENLDETLNNEEV